MRFVEWFSKEELRGIHFVVLDARFCSLPAEPGFSFKVTVGVVCNVREEGAY